MGAVDARVQVKLRYGELLSRQGHVHNGKDSDNAAGLRLEDSKRGQHCEPRPSHLWYSSALAITVAQYIAAAFGALTAPIAVLLLLSQMYLALKMCLLTLVSRQAGPVGDESSHDVGRSVGS